MTLSAVPPRRRFAAILGAVTGVLFASWCAGSAQAQDRTVVIGSPSADPVTVDLSVLDGGGARAAGAYGDLLFPGSRYKPGQRVILSPPGMVANRPVLRPPSQARPQWRAIARRPAARPAPATVARRAAPSRPAPVAKRRPPNSAPPPPPQIAMPAPAPKRTTPPVAAVKPPSDAALAAIKPAAGPSQVAPAAKPKPPLAAPEIKKRTSAPPPAAKPAQQTARASVPPARSAADIPPPPPEVMAAPRTPVTTQAAPVPAPPPAPKTQVASIPRTGSVTDRGQQQIIFAPGSAKLEGAGKATLAAIAKSLAQDPARRVELRAYAKGTDDNPSQARRLSLSRALAIRSALIAEGVKPTRIDVRALGNRVPSGVPNRVDLSVSTR